MALAVLAALTASAHAEPPFSGPAWAVDADTIHVLNARTGTRVRLHGIDAPERLDLCARARSPVRCDVVAAPVTQAMIDGGVTCRVTDTDRYKRTVAICHDSTGRDIGRELVRQGLARAYRRYSKDYVADESAARTRRAGWWDCATTAPDQWESLKTYCR